MVGITQTSDGRWRRVDDARCIEPFRTATLRGRKTFRGAAVSSAQLTFVTFLGQFRIEFGSYPVGQTMSI